jgi:hypothetical protein
MKKSTLFVLWIIVASVVSANLEVFDEISAAIRSGSSREVAKFMNSNVDMTIISQEDVYSKTQAEAILKDFFAKHPPKSFNFIHQGNSQEGARYAIGSYVTAQGTTFRTYVFVKQNGGKFFIHELRFEKE